MSRTYSAAQLKNQHHPKVSFDQYLNDDNEPRDGVYGVSRSELEAALINDSYGMRRQVRRLAQRLRNR